MTRPYAEDEDEPIGYDWKVAALEEGWREGTVNDAFVKDKDGAPLTTKNGDKMIRVLFKLEPTGRVMLFLILGTDAGNAQLRALGFAEGEPISIAKLKGRSAMLLCKREEFPKGSGNWNLGVDSFNKDCRGGMKPIDPAVLAERKAAADAAAKEAALDVPF